MGIYPIKTEADYDRALAEVEAIWGVKEYTEKGDRLDVLIVLIDHYENTGALCFWRVNYKNYGLH